MTKYKCDICGEKYDKERITIECPYCYFKGCEIELNKPRKQFLKVIQKLKKNGKLNAKEWKLCQDKLQTTN